MVHRTHYTVTGQGENSLASVGVRTRRGDGQFQANRGVALELKGPMLFSLTYYYVLYDRCW